MSVEDAMEWLAFLRRPWVSRLINGASFYMVWFACIGFAADGNPWPGIISSIVLIAFHFLITDNWRLDVAMMIILSAMGLIMDSAYIHLDVLEFKSPVPFVNWVAPLWVVLLYTFFATTLNCSLRYLGAHPVALSILGTFGGPFCYWAGVQMGAANFATEGPQPLLIIAAVWCFCMPIVAHINRRLRQTLGSV